MARLANRYRCTADYLLGLVDDPIGGRALRADERALLAAGARLSAEEHQVVVSILEVLAESTPARRDYIVSILRLLADSSRPHIVGEEE